MTTVRISIKTKVLKTKKCYKNCVLKKFKILLIHNAVDFFLGSAIGTKIQDQIYIFEISRYEKTDFSDTSFAIFEENKFSSLRRDNEYF
jgi:hypothetical protein